MEVLSDQGDVIARLQRRHPAGFFAGNVSATSPYLLRIDWAGGPEETEDPYSFNPLLGPLDLHLFSEGRHFELVRVFGARCMSVDGIAGVRFAVWAPNASRVSVVGDFNTWDGRRHPMRKRPEAGIWEIFIPRIGPGRFISTNCSASGDCCRTKPIRWPSETELPPGTASRVHASVPHAWEDEDWMTSRRRARSRRTDLNL